MNRRGSCPTVRGGDTNEFICDSPRGLCWDLKNSSISSTPFLLLLLLLQHRHYYNNTLFVHAANWSLSGRALSIEPTDGVVAVSNLAPSHQATGQSPIEDLDSMRAVNGGASKAWTAERTRTARSGEYPCPRRGRRRRHPIPGVRPMTSSSRPRRFGGARLDDGRL